jgi:hypothetical protein
VSALAQFADEYLVLRRGAGFTLTGADKLLGEFSAFIDERGGRVTVELAMEWATAKSGGTRSVALRRHALGRAAALDRPPLRPLPPGRLARSRSPPGRAGPVPQFPGHPLPLLRC